MKLLISMILILGSISAYSGNDGRGGGDMCENRVQTIRDDLKQWINKGGHKNLKLSLSAGDYAALMLSEIGKAKIKCVRPGEKGYPVQVDNTPKVCRFDKTKRSSSITCDAEKFQSTSESDQYILIHHEYAGLAGIEQPNGNQSTYNISNQISGFLVDQVIKKLAIKPLVTPAKPPEKLEWTRLNGAEGVQTTKILKDAVDRFHTEKCHARFLGPEADSPVNTCGGEKYYSSVAELSFTYIDGVNNRLIENMYVAVGEFNCDLSSSAKKGIYLFKEKSGLPIYKQLFRNLYKTDFSEYKNAPDVVVIYTLNADRSKTTHLQLLFSGEQMVNKGTPGSPSWVKEEVVQHGYYCGE